MLDAKWSIYHIFVIISAVSQLTMTDNLTVQSAKCGVTQSSAISARFLGIWKVLITSRDKLMFYDLLDNFQKPRIGLACIAFHLSSSLFYLLCSICVHLCSTCALLYSLVFIYVPMCEVF